jgi:hypothetical protein
MLSAPGKNKAACAIAHTVVVVLPHWRGLRQNGCTSGDIDLRHERGQSYPATRVRLSSVCRIELIPEIATAIQPCCSV